MEKPRMTGRQYGTTAIQENGGTTVSQPGGQSGVNHELFISVGGAGR